jgi:ankyrin repeat protein
MRAIVSTLIATVACVGSLGALAAQPPGAAAPQIPQLSREQALAYLEQRRLAPAPGNLVSPILHGDAEAVEALLAAGVDVNDTSELPKSALRLAASACANKEIEPQKTLATVEVLLAHGAKPSESEPSELSALLVAAQWCPPPVIRRLVRAGADLQFHSSVGHTPLGTALSLGNYDGAEALIDAGARLSPEAASRLLANRQDNARLAALVKRARAQ